MINDLTGLGWWTKVRQKMGSAIIFSSKYRITTRSAVYIFCIAYITIFVVVGLISIGRMVCHFCFMLSRRNSSLDAIVGVSDAADRSVVRPGEPAHVRVIGKYGPATALPLPGRPL